jgi:hypothetical protein
MFNNKEENLTFKLSIMIVNELRNYFWLNDISNDSKFLWISDNNNLEKKTKLVLKVYLYVV